MTRDLFELKGRVAIITGGGGLLGYHHASAIADFGGIPVLLDIDGRALLTNSERLRLEFDDDFLTLEVDVTDFDSVVKARDKVLERHHRIDILINNAARNPKLDDGDNASFSRLENFPADQWQKDLDVGLGGAFTCSRVFGGHMASVGRGGVIINIASDLGIIAPDQRLYEVAGQANAAQPVKPVTYSVVKHGILGLTKYLATYWCGQGIRCNALSPGGVYTGQDAVFVSKLANLIPLGRMAKKEEYRGAIAFLSSDASSYMNGANLIIDGGRSVW